MESSKSLLAAPPLAGAAPLATAGHPPNAPWRGAGAAPAPSPPAVRLLVRRAGVWRVVPLDRIDWIEADGNYVRIHAGGEVLTCRRTLGGMAARLDPERFVRIHRGAIVHIDRIAELVPTPSGTYVVHLRDGTRLTLSRGQRARVLALVGRV